MADHPIRVAGIERPDRRAHRAFQPLEARTGRARDGRAMELEPELDRTSNPGRCRIAHHVSFLKGTLDACKPSRIDGRNWVHRSTGRRCFLRANRAHEITRRTPTRSA